MTDVDLGNQGSSNPALPNEEGKPPFECSAQLLLSLLGGLGVANITLAVTQLPSVEGTFALLVDILLSLGIWRVWQVVRGESVGRDQVSLQLTIGALLLLVSSLIHLFVGMGGHQIIVVVVVLLCLPFCVAGLQSLLMILIGSVVLWAFVSSIVASPVETAITTIAAIVTCAIALANWNWLRTLQSRAEEAIDEDLRTNHGALNRLVQYKMSLKGGVIPTQDEPGGNLGKVD